MFGVMVCRRASSTLDGGIGHPGSQVADENTGEELVVLKAFSGQMTNYWHVTGWVGPVAGIINNTPLYHHYRTLTEAHSARLASLDLALHLHDQQQQQQPSSGSQPEEENQKRNNQRRQRQKQRQQSPQGSRGAAAAPEAGARAFLERQRRLLRARRKALSHELLGRIQRSYRIRNFTGRHMLLLQVYDDAVHRRVGVAGRDGDRGGDGDGAHEEVEVEGREEGRGGPLSFPAGTGDCCAPKLLWAAVQRGLTPLGMVEFWYGSPPNTATAQGRRGGGGGGEAAATRVHGEMYGMCDKCEVILGSMLCGALAAAPTESGLGSMDFDDV